MTDVDQAEAVAITIHSSPTKSTEILVTEFLSCYIAADMAWHYDIEHQEELEKASKGKRGKQRKTETEDNMLGLGSPMRGLPVSSTHAPSATPYLLLPSTDPTHLHT
jgi:hypothetical protein